MKTLIIDDEKIAVENLRFQLIEQEEAFDIVGTANSVKSGLELIEKIKPEVVFLDIEMGDGTGFDLLSSLDEIDFKVVFVTAYDQYAIQAFKVSAIDYILKPLDPEELGHAILKVKESIGSNENKPKIKNLLKNVSISDPFKRRIMVRDSTGIKYPEVSKILYLKADGSYCKVFMNNGDEVVSSKVLKHFVEVLPEEIFMRIHRSALVNLNEVDEFLFKDGGCVVMSNGAEVYVSDDKKKELLAVLESRT